MVPMVWSAGETLKHGLHLCGHHLRRSVAQVTCDLGILFGFIDGSGLRDGAYTHTCCAAFCVVCTVVTK